jgi:CRP/FNR family transcriptional regulator, cyclic AMP receptor protein
MHLPNHAQCAALSALFRGSLCEQLASGPGRLITSGQFLYRVGADARSVFLIRHGLVKVSTVSARGQEITLRVYKSGDVFGELCLCTGERQEQAVALEDTDVVEIPVERFLTRLQQDPRVAIEFATTACERLAEAHERLRSIAVDPVLGRLVRALLMLATDLGDETPLGTELTHHFAQDELAQIVGARREVVSTLLNRLRDKGFLSYSRGGPMRIDRVRLQNLRNWLDTDGDVLAR